MVPVDGLDEPITRAVMLGESDQDVDEIMRAGTPVRGQKKSSAKDLLLADWVGPKPSTSQSRGEAIGVCGTPWRQR